VSWSELDGLRERIIKDIEELKKKKPEGEALRYLKDAEYYLKKGLLITAFGCIAYAWGLYDAVHKYR